MSWRSMRRSPAVDPACETSTRRVEGLLSPIPLKSGHMPSNQPAGVQHNDLGNLEQTSGRLDRSVEKNDVLALAQRVDRQQVEPSVGRQETRQERSDLIGTACRPFVPRDDGVGAVQIDEVANSPIATKLQDVLHELMRCPFHEGNRRMRTASTQPRLTRAASRILMRRAFELR